MTAQQLNKLEREFHHFIQVHEKLKREYPLGGHVVIKDEQVLGVWETRNEALTQGLQKYGDVVFLVRSLADEPDHHVSFSFNTMVWTRYS